MHQHRVRHLKMIPENVAEVDVKYAVLDGWFGELDSRYTYVASPVSGPVLEEGVPPAPRVHVKSPPEVVQTPWQKLLVPDAKRHV